MKKQLLIETARKLALKSRMYRRHGAILTSGSKILAIGKNCYRPHSTGYTIHAECSALAKVKVSKVSKFKNGLTIYVVRINEHGNLCDSKPCWHCLQEMIKSGIGKVIFSTNGGTCVRSSPYKLLEQAKICYGMKILYDGGQYRY